MIDKQSFLDKLNAALLDRGVSESDIRPYLERFDRYFDRMVGDDGPAGAGALDDIDNIADNIAAQVSERYDEINRLAERTMTIGQVQADDQPTMQTDIAELDDTSEGYEPVEENAPTGLVPTGEAALAAEEADEAVSRLPDYVDEEPVQNSTMFWILFAVSLPVTIPLALLIVGVFVLLTVGLAALIVGAVAALIVLVAAGTAASLVGIIYGIIQLFSVVPVGLYEIGMGIVIAGVVMFAGILLYNLAIRLIPFTIRMLWRLFGFLYRKLKVLFNYLRKECAKL